MNLVTNVTKKYLGKKFRWLFGIFIYGCSLTIYAVPVTGLGLNPVGQIDTSNIIYSTVHGYNRNYAGAFFFGIAPVGLPNALYQCSDMLKVQKSLDGKYTGIRLATGVTLVFYDSTISSTTVFTSGSQTKVITFNSYGAMTNNYDSSTFCSAAAVNNSYADNHVIPKTLPANAGMSGILKYGIYVESAATSGTNVPVSFAVIKVGVDSGEKVTEEAEVNMVSCTVSTPSEIDFGTINAGDTAPVLSNSGDLNVNCNGSGKTVTIDYSATSPSENGSGTALVMKNTQNQSQGVVRGFIGETAEVDAGCTNKSSSMYFNGTPVTLITKTENNKGNRFPLTWVLCPDVTPGLGNGNASAILNVIWK